MAVNLKLTEFAESAASFFRAAVEETTKMFTQMKTAFQGLANISFDKQASSETALASIPNAKSQGHNSGRGGGGIS